MGHVSRVKLGRNLLRKGIMRDKYEGRFREKWIKYVQMDMRTIKHKRLEKIVQQDVWKEFLRKLRFTKNVIYQK